MCCSTSINILPRSNKRTPLDDKIRAGSISSGKLNLICGSDSFLSCFQKQCERGVFM